MPSDVDGEQNRRRRAVAYVTGAVAVELVASVIMAGFATWLLWRGFGGPMETVLDDFVWAIKWTLGKILLVDMVKQVASTGSFVKGGVVFEAISYAIAFVVVLFLKNPARDVVGAIR